MEPAMIRGVTHLSIRDTSLTMINQANLESRALDSLRSNCSLAALVDANKRFDPPRCAEATRRYIIQKIEDWVLHDDLQSTPSSIFWLYGGAGAGKSALAQTLAEKFKANENLAATFFFFKSDVDRNNGNHFITTLALQLVRSFQGLSHFVEEKILQNPYLFEKNRRTQMLDLLIEPLIRLSLEETNGMQSENATLKLHPRLVVIDGLDECIGWDTQCDLLQIISSAIPHFPYPLRFLITSRPESHITRAFQYDVGKVAQYNLSDDPDSDKDIQHFLEAEFAKICSTHPLRQYLSSQWPPQASISSIVQRSSAHFIYAATVVRYIQSTKHSPDERLQVILGLAQANKHDRPYHSLDLLYSLIFLEIKDPGELEKIHRALGMMHLRSLKCGLLESSRWTSDRRAIEELLELPPGKILLLFDALLSLVAFDQEDIRIFHKSLLDYLLDSSRSGDLHLDLGLAHETVADYILRRGEMQNSWDPVEFRLFFFHCQFARLNDILTSYLRSLGRDPKTAFSESEAESPSAPHALSKKTCIILQSMLYFLQVISRQDFDSSGRCYGWYVKKKIEYLRLAVPWSQRLKSTMIPGLPSAQVCTHLKGCLLSTLRSFDWTSDSKGLELNRLTKRPVPVITIASINQEHEMISSYLNMLHQYPDIVVSFLEPTLPGHIHSCHFVIRKFILANWSVSVVTLMVLMTYTEYGVRLSCSAFERSDGLSLELTSRSMVEGHYQSVMKKEENEKLAQLYTASIARFFF